MKQHKQKPVIIATLALLVAITGSSTASATCYTTSGYGEISPIMKKGFDREAKGRARAIRMSVHKAWKLFQSRKPNWQTAKYKKFGRYRNGRRWYIRATATYCMPGKLNVRQIPKYKLPSGVYHKKP